MKFALPERCFANKQLTDGRSYRRFQDGVADDGGIGKAGPVRSGTRRLPTVAAVAVGFLAVLAGTAHIGLDAHVLSLAGAFVLAVIALRRL